LPAISTLPDEAATVKFPPPTSRLPTTVRSCPMLVSPPATPPVPIPILVPAPNALIVVALVLSRLKVVWLVVTSPPLTSKSPVNIVSPPTFKFSAIPTPPATVNAPVVLLVEVVVCSNLCDTMSN